MFRTIVVCVLEIFKILNDINLTFITDILQLRMTNRPTREKYKLNLEIPKSNHVRFETKHLKHLDSKVWNSLPYHIKSSENLSISKTLINNLNETVSTCKKCKKWNYTFTFILFSLYIICTYTDFDWCFLIIYLCYILRYLSKENKFNKTNQPF